MDIIKKRRSIRKFTEQPVQKDDLLTILDAAMRAPSARNQQPWEFLVIDDKSIIQKVAEVGENAAPAKNATAIILACADQSKVLTPGYWEQDLGACVQNMLLKITDLELGGVWLGIHPRENRVNFLRELFLLPDNITPFALIAIGYPAEEKEPSNRFDKNRIRWNKW